MGWIIDTLVDMTHGTFSACDASQFILIQVTHRAEVRNRIHITWEALDDDHKVIDVDSSKITANL